MSGKREMRHHSDTASKGIRSRNADSSAECDVVVETLESRFLDIHLNFSPLATLLRLTGLANGVMIVLTFHRL